MYQSMNVIEVKMNETHNIDGRGRRSKRRSSESHTLIPGLLEPGNWLISEGESRGYSAKDSAPPQKSCRSAARGVWSVE